MTAEDLLKPRFKVISDYPFSEFKVGDIIDFSEDSSFKSGNIIGTNCNVNFFKQYPTIFKELLWYEHREEKEMPKYLKFHYGEVYKISHWSMVYMVGYLDNRNCCDLKLWGKGYGYIPATEEEYLNQQPVSTK